jgi:hypothetical protein
MFSPVACAGAETVVIATAATIAAPAFRLSLASQERMILFPDLIS